MKLTLEIIIIKMNRIRYKELMMIEVDQMENLKKTITTKESERKILFLGSNL